MQQIKIKLNEIFGDWLELLDVEMELEGQDWGIEPRRDISTPQHFLFIGLAIKY